MLSNVLAAGSPDRAGIFPCSFLHWLRLVSFCRDKFSEGPSQNSAAVAHVRHAPPLPCTILSRSSRSGNREENVSNLPWHSDIHRTSKGKQSCIGNFSYGDMEKTSRENVRDHNPSSHSQKYSTPTTDASRPPPIKAGFPFCPPPLFSR